ncbi:MAG: ClpXP protease specificity-enhancing factor SspB [Pseudomonadota bacterium]
MNADNGLNYGHLMQKAMRSMMADVLCHVVDHGLPGDHHFYICFETDHPGVDIPSWLRETYPEEMTIVLQEWFRDLEVAKDRFSVTLNFSDQAQTLVVPFAAVRTFVDPSVKFGLKFDAYEADEVPVDPVLPEEETAPQEPVAASHSAEVVSIDSFRKN